MKTVSLKDRILKYLQNRPGVKISGGELEKLAMGAGFKPSNGGRRARELRASGLIKGEEIKGSIWYWYQDPEKWFNDL